VDIDACHPVGGQHKQLSSTRILITPTNAVDRERSVCIGAAALAVAFLAMSMQLMGDGG
jgi:hypothetical protein